jgi:hypothetical protein
LNVEVEKKERNVLDSTAEMSTVQPRGIRGSRRAPGLTFHVNESKLEKLEFKPAGFVVCEHVCSNNCRRLLFEGKSWECR